MAKKGGVQNEKTFVISRLNYSWRVSRGLSGEMSEWLKEHAWKVCILQKGIQGSNPCLSAE